MTYKEILEEMEELRVQLDDLDNELFDKLEADALTTKEEVKELSAQTDWMLEVLRKMEVGILDTKTLLKKMNLL